MLFRRPLYFLCKLNTGIREPTLIVKAKAVLISAGQYRFISPTDIRSSEPPNIAISASGSRMVMLAGPVLEPQLRLRTLSAVHVLPYSDFSHFSTRMCWENVFIKWTSNHRRSTAWHKFHFWRQRISLNCKVHGHQLILFNNQSLSRETWLYCPKLNVECFTQKQCEHTGPW
jgi:hypothetical protein